MGSGLIILLGKRKNKFSKKKGLQNEDLFNSLGMCYFLPRAIFDLATLPPLSI